MCKLGRKHCTSPNALLCPDSHYKDSVYSGKFSVCLSSISWKIYIPLEHEEPLEHFHRWTIFQRTHTCTPRKDENWFIMQFSNRKNTKISCTISQAYATEVYMAMVCCFFAKSWGEMFRILNERPLLRFPFVRFLGWNTTVWFQNLHCVYGTDQLQTQRISNIHFCKIWEWYVEFKLRLNNASNLTNGFHIGYTFFIACIYSHKISIATRFGRLEIHRTKKSQILKCYHINEGMK